MIKILLSDGSLIGLAFCHPKVSKAFYEGPEIVRASHCEIFTLDPSDPTKATLLAEGVAKCVKGDIFQKEKGRKIALGRALKASPLIKEDRTLIWNGYRGRPRTPSTPSDLEPLAAHEAAV